MEKETVRLIERERPVNWHGYRPVALDDTKSHRTSKKVWGVCTFREYASRSPNRATTVRAHNWVVLGDLIPDQPWWYLPHSGRVYFRESQLPEREVQTGIGPVSVRVPRVRDRSGSGIVFHSKLLPPYLRRAKSISPQKRRLRFFVTVALSQRRVDG